MAHRTPLSTTPRFPGRARTGGVIARHIDHVNRRIPSDAAEAARTFYGERLGFDIEDTRYEADEKPFFDVRRRRRR